MIPLEAKLWCDCETDEDRAVFLLSGMAVATGIVAPAIVPELAQAFRDRERLRAALELLRGYMSNCLNEVYVAPLKSSMEKLAMICEEALKNGE